MSEHSPQYIDTAAAAERFLYGLRGIRALAVDTEGASFHRYVDRIYLLQMASDGEEAILDPLAIGKPGGLGSLLEDPAVEIVLHDADYDLRLLHKDYGYRVTNLFDTRVAAQLLGIRAFGLAALLDQYFNIKLDKKHQRADWSMRPLTADMLDYAAQDTRFLLALRDRLNEDLEKKGRLHWAREEFLREEDTHWEPEEPGTGFLRLKGARDLTRRELARLRELVQWRDGIAAELDRATFRVAGNEVLLELSRIAPTTRESLYAVKGFPKGMTEARAQEALKAIDRGSKVPESELPKFPKAPRWERDSDFDERVSRIKKIRDGIAADLDLDPGVLCSRDRMEAVVRRKPRGVDDLAEIPDLRRWQIEVIGAPFVSALNSSGERLTVTTPGLSSGSR